MGNCISHPPEQHVRVKDDGPYTPRKGSRLIRLHWNRSSRADDNDERIDLKVHDSGGRQGSNSTTMTDGTSTVGTFPLSPEDQSFLSFISTPRSLSTRADFSTGADQPLSPDKEGAGKDGAHHPSRALRQRLQKAKYMQMVMSSPTPKLENDDNPGPMRIARPKSNKNASDDGLSTNSLSFLRRNLNEADDSSSKDATTQEETVHSNLTNDEFDATLNKGKLWAELETGSPVLAVAISRQDATIDCPTPPVFLAVGTERGDLRIMELLDYNTTSGSSRRLGSPLKHNLDWKGRIRALDFLPGDDGNCLAVAGDEGLCALLRLDPARGTNSNKHSDCDVHVLAEIHRDDRIYACRFSPDGQFIALGGYDSTVNILDLTCLTAPRTVAEIPVSALVSTLDWSPDGAYLAIGGSEKTCTIVSVAERCEVICQIRRPSAIHAVRWHPLLTRGPNRYHLAIGSTNIVLLEREHFSVCREIDLEMPPVQDEGGASQSSVCSNTSSANSLGNNIRLQDLCWSSNGNYLVTVDNYNQAKLLETTAFTTIQEMKHGSSINCLVWGEQVGVGHENQNFLAMGTQDGKVLVLKAGPLELQGDDNASTGASTKLSREWTLNDHAFTDVDETSVPMKKTKVNSSSSRWEWALHQDNFSSFDGDQECQLDVLDEEEEEETDRIQTGPVRAMAFSCGKTSHPSRFFATASLDGLVTVRSTSSGWKVLCQMEFLDPITCISFSNGSGQMALGSNDGKVRVISTSPDWTVATEIEAETPVMGLAFSTNNERLAIAGNDGIIALVDPDQDFTNALILEQESTVTAMDWSLTHLAAGQEDGIVCIYHTSDLFEDTTRVITTLTRTCPVRALAFGSNSRFLVVGGDDGMLGVYSSAGDWALVHRVPVEFGIESLKWSPSGRHLAVGNTNELKVLDTAFWADVEEVQKAYAEDDCHCLNDSVADEVLPSRRKFQSLTFSQDGRLLAFTEQKSGAIRVVSTTSWDVVFSLGDSQENLSSI
mmetsp:Transcript_12543/g.27611  ORF Transcript_12543/g.27611 Transcript_12543/m.27611 type:complete len:998 (+) Transcript_12543:203-3196(+)